jgi:hypothetical protein
MQVDKLFNQTIQFVFPFVLLLFFNLEMIAFVLVTHTLCLKGSLKCHTS